MEVKIQRLPLNTSPTARLNAYNRHALAPWLQETGYLTPLYLHRREQERLPFNMSRWMTDKISAHMLRPPKVVFDLDHQLVTRLLQIAARCQYSPREAEQYSTDIQGLAQSLPSLPASSTGYFVRLSESSPKDVDDGNLQAVHSVKDALTKLVCSKRAVQALLALNDARDEVLDNKLYFFPYYASLDPLSEWRCYVHNSQVVAISQSRFYQPHHAGVADDVVREMVAQVRLLWNKISAGLKFASCALDVYAEVHKPHFEVKLIEINPYFPHVGSGSLLFHWIDDKDILLGPARFDKQVVVRLVKPENKVDRIGRQDAYRIGRAGIIEDELNVLRQRGLEWILEPACHDRFMQLPVPGRFAGTATTTRQAGVARFMEGPNADDKAAVAPSDHPRFRKLQQAYHQTKPGQSSDS